ncbi:uncharacterized protein Dwil_GK28237 [Drosophila willistoni]|uniref:MARVEL domain-containing protein n=2 Tax=Drosophila willistoni TaxID=7260 RepID=A0A0Q9WTL3_DROWI|nr:uncharacterized protein Dwil_GK28237 [Drosophila willistoni]
MKFRLSKCCFVFDLRLGCFLVALTGLFFELIGNSCGNEGEYSEFPTTPMVVVGRTVGMLQFIACIILFVSAIVEISALICIYLVISIGHIVFGTGCLIVAITKWDWDHNSLTDTVLIGIGLVFSVYFWLVAYSYYQKCRRILPTEVFED